MRRFLRRLRRRVLPGLRHLPASRVRRCGCCGRTTVIVALGSGDEFRRCLRCGANLRYELLASWIREHCELRRLDVLELDPGSPLRPLLARSRSYRRSYYAAAPGAPPPAPGVRHEDITALSLPDSSVDLIVSSEVLEHVPELAAALDESLRVLRPGGAHVFTVPPRRTTRRRARIARDGSVEHLAEPEYHADPLDPRGILAFWDVGTEDAGEHFSRPGLELAVVAGPAGLDGRVVWRARRV